jgi:hypothetical protein
MAGKGGGMKEENDEEIIRQHEDAAKDYPCLLDTIHCLPSRRVVHIDEDGKATIWGKKGEASNAAT